MKILTYSCGDECIDNITLCEECDIADHVDNADDWEVIDEYTWGHWTDPYCDTEGCDYEYPCE